MMDKNLDILVTDCILPVVRIDQKKFRLFSAYGVATTSNFPKQVPFGPEKVGYLLGSCV